MEMTVDERTGQAAKDDALALDPALRDKARRWFAEAHEQTQRDDEEIAAWLRYINGDGGSGGIDVSSDRGSGDGGGGGD